MFSRVCVALLLPLTFVAVTGMVEARAAASTDSGKWEKRDFNGVWQILNNDRHGANEVAPDLSRIDDWGFDTLPQLKPPYLQETQRAHKPVTCQAHGLPGLLAGPYATEILQNEQQINWFQEFPGQTWRIYLDGRPHPNADEYPATLNGHSTGKWDGDTLVVDSVNIRTDTLLYGQGRSEKDLGHSDKLHVVNRIRRIDRDHLQVEGTVEDPEALVKPWHYTLVFHRHPDVEVIEYLCEDNIHDFWDEKNQKEVTEIPKQRNVLKSAQERK